MCHIHIPSNCFDAGWNDNVSETTGEVVILVIVSCLPFLFIKGGKNWTAANGKVQKIYLVIEEGY